MRAFAVWTTVAFYVITKSLERMNYKFSKEIDVIMFKDYKKERRKGGGSKKETFKEKQKPENTGCVKTSLFCCFTNLTKFLCV